MTQPLQNCNITLSVLKENYSYNPSGFLINCRNCARVISDNYNTICNNTFSSILILKGTNIITTSETRTE